MSFTSLDFGIFVPIVFLLYWFVFNKNLKLQNFLIVAASYVFYGWWDWRFLFLMAFSSLLDFVVGLGLNGENRERIRKTLLLTSIIGNLGLLGFFKYYNFFVQSFATSFSFFGYSFSPNTLNIILPVGISFYTFQTLSYSIDVYRRKLEPTRDLIAFIAFVSFFPQLVAGPIERATNLLPQFFKHRVFEYDKAVDGLKQILWGLFKKMVIADSCGSYVNSIFDGSNTHSGSSILIAAMLFLVQLYGDFSGYSDIAIGTSRLFGFSLKQNFAYPFFSRDVPEFFRRWHISLVTWFRDYLYIPLGGNKAGRLKNVRNTFIIFVVMGFWHGANWTFVIWGAICGIYFLPSLLFNKKRYETKIVAQNRILPTLSEFLGMCNTFFILSFSGIFFRSADLNQALGFYSQICSKSLFSAPEPVSSQLLILFTLFMVVEWIGREKLYAIENLGVKLIKPLRWAMYFVIVFITFYFANEGQEFIYFQF